MSGRAQSRPNLKTSRKLRFYLQIKYIFIFDNAQGHKSILEYFI
ncbi:MAG: hypothetical protein TRG1_496 [Flavobacteriaceae bacterium FS1-H7996/R]|nr:MAG: hypothetical protein TRG1_496 [Flavobacteriaceae bacterium FS1-H7996/R]